MIQFLNQENFESIIQNEAATLLQVIYRRFLLFLEEKQIKYIVQHKESHSQQISTVFLLYMCFGERQIDVICKIELKYLQKQHLMGISISFKISKIADRSLAQFNHRTRIELIASISQINKYLATQNSCLNVAFDLYDSLIMSHRIYFLSSQNRDFIKQMAANALNTSFKQFIKYFGELNDVDFFGSAGKIQSFQSLRQILSAFYLNKMKLFVRKKAKQQQTLKTCLSFLFKNATEHNSAISNIEEQNKHQQNLLTANQILSTSNDIIGNAVKIQKNQQSDPYMANLFQKNLRKNQANKSNDGIVTLKKIRFQLRKSLGHLRQNKENEIFFDQDECQKDQKIYQQHMVIKRCLSFRENIVNHGQNEQKIQSEYNQYFKQGLSTTYHNNENKTKYQCGQQNQYNFVMVNGNLKCPYIGKYYLDISQASIGAISKRTIMTQFQKGDLFTQVAYNTYNRIKQYQFIEYLTIFEQLAQAVVFLHRNKILHRDIKPTNILFRYYSRNKFVCKLIDFGSCFILRQSVSHLFNPKLYTTPSFNITYQQAIKQKNDQIGNQFTQHAYQTHELFDIYSIAQTVSYLLENSIHQDRNEYLDTIIKICKNVNPNERFTPEQLVTVLRHIKLKLMIGKPINKLYKRRKFE